MVIKMKIISLKNRRWKLNLKINYCSLTKLIKASNKSKLKILKKVNLAKKRNFWWKWK